MFIGGSPGSTAGGVKVTTAVVMVLSTIAMVRGTHGVNILDRRLEESAVKRASAIVTIDLGLAVAAALIIMSAQPLKLSDALFEVFSAIGTVGMTTGITRELVPLSRIVIILLMYCGCLLYTSARVANYIDFGMASSVDKETLFQLLNEAAQDRMDEQVYARLLDDLEKADKMVYLSLIHI